MRFSSTKSTYEPASPNVSHLFRGKQLIITKDPHGCSNDSSGATKKDNIWSWLTRIVYGKRFATPIPGKAQGSEATAGGSKSV